MEQTLRMSSAMPLPALMRRDLVGQYASCTHTHKSRFTLPGLGSLTPLSILHVQGVIHEDHLRELLTTMGDRFTDEEVDELFREAPIDKKGNFNYAEFTRILKHGAKDKDDE